MAKDSKQMTGYLYVLAAAVLWSLIGPFSKICMEEGLAPLEVAFWRALLGGIMGFSTDDTRIRNSFSIATERGLSYSFTPCETETDVLLPFRCVEHQRVFQFAANLHPAEWSRHGDGAAVYGSRMGGRILPHPVP